MNLGPIRVTYSILLTHILTQTLPDILMDPNTLLWARLQLSKCKNLIPVDSVIQLCDIAKSYLA